MFSFQSRRAAAFSLPLMMMSQLGSLAAGASIQLAQLINPAELVARQRQDSGDGGTSLATFVATLARPVVSAILAAAALARSHFLLLLAKASTAASYLYCKRAHTLRKWHRLMATPTIPRIENRAQANLRLAANSIGASKHNLYGCQLKLKL